MTKTILNTEDVSRAQAAVYAALSRFSGTTPEAVLDAARQLEVASRILRRALKTVGA